jgi:phosphatidylserine decarboxylase
MFSKIFPPIHTEGYKFLVIAGFITLVLLFISGFLGTIRFAINCLGLLFF